MTRIAFRILTCVFATVLVLIPACTKPDRPHPNDGASASPWPARFSEIIDEGAASLPPSFVGELAATASSIVEQAPVNKEFDEWMDTILQATKRHVSHLPETFEDSPERRRAEIAALRFALEYLVAVGPPDPQEARHLESQIAVVIEEGTDWARNQYASFGDEVIGLALAQFEGRLTSQCYSELNPLLCRPIPEDKEAESLEHWRLSMEAVRGQIESQYRVYSLDPNMAPEWELERIQQNKVTIVRETLSTYLDVRRGSFSSPSRMLAKLHEDFESARREIPPPDPDEEVREMGRKRTRGDWDIDVQEYEALTAIYDTLSPLNRFQPIVDATTGKVFLWTNFPANYPAITLPYTVEYIGDDNIRLLDGVRAQVRGFLTISGDGRVRTELTDRSSLWRSRGIYYEPIGTTIEWARDEVRVYHPGEWELDTFIVSEEVSDWPDRSPTLLVPSGRRIKAEPASRLLISPGRIVDRKENAASGTVDVTVEWKEARPSLYAVEIPRAQYTYHLEGEKQTLISAELYCGDAETVAAEIQWRKPVEIPSLPDAFLEVEMTVHEPALLNPREQIGPPNLIVDPRIVTWEYRVSESAAEPILIPSSISIQTNSGEFVLSATFGDPLDASYLTLPEDLADPAAYMVADEGYRLDYYRLLKEYFREWRGRDALPPVQILTSYVERAEAIAIVAEEHNDEDLLYAAQRLLRDWYAILEDYTALIEVTKKNLALTGRIADDKQFSFEAGTAISAFTKSQRYAEAIEMIDSLADTMRMRINAPYCIESGGAYLAAREPAKAAAYFTAAAAKLERGTPLRQQALLGCISAWRKLKDEFCSSNANADHCKKLTVRINSAIDEYLANATDKERQVHADLLSKVP